MIKGKKIWMDGKLVPWDKANVHFMTHSLHYGTGCFEGIRCYQTKDKRVAIFRLNDHVERLFHSWHIFGLKIPFTQKQVTDAIIKTVKENKVKNGYVRPLVYLSSQKIGIDPEKCKVSLGIAAFNFGAYLGEKGLEKGIRTKISSFSRYFVNSMMTKGKFTGEYIISSIAKKEAHDLGFEEAIMLDTNGFVSEGTGENIFIIRDNELITPPKSTILEGITRDTILKMAEHFGIENKERFITRDQLYIADEVFLSGTAAEITPVIEVDNRKIGNGKPGKMTKFLQKSFFEITLGKNPEFEEMLTYL